jgi:hypothetical protein
METDTSKNNYIKNASALQSSMNDNNDNEIKTEMTVTLRANQE